jgi:MFS transporter, DHA1 family, multidrug resistance protein
LPFLQSERFENRSTEANGTTWPDAVRSLAMTDTATKTPAPVRSQREFVAIATVCTTLAALSIDTTLPAFKAIRAHYGLAPDATNVSWVVSGFMLGMAVGALFFGTLSDRFGRKRLLVGGLMLFVVAGVAAATAPSLGVLFAARVVWGFAAAAPRAVILAMVRDRFEGDAMARIASLMMAAFMIVPVLAPSLGQGLLTIGPWQLAMWVPTLIGGGVLVWVLVRLPETLAVENRRSVGPAALADAARAILRSRATVGFTLAVVFCFGILSSVLSGLEIVVDKVFGHHDQFPLVFGGMSLVMMAATYAGSREVTKRGTAAICRIAAACLVLFAVVMALFVELGPRRPIFIVFCVLLALMMASQNALVPNANSAAMEPVGHVAGAAASVIAFVSTAGGALLGQIVTSRFDGTARPFAIGSLVFAVLAAVAVWVTLRSPATHK